jgi:hypothetical protein
MIRSGSGGCWIDFDPVISHFWSYLRGLPVEDDQICLLLGHVAINAIVCDGMVCPREGRGIRFVAAQAALRKFGHVVLRGMDVVAGEAGYV